MAELACLLAWPSIRLSFAPIHGHVLRAGTALWPVGRRTRVGSASRLRHAHARTHARRSLIPPWPARAIPLPGLSLYAKAQRMLEPPTPRTPHSTTLTILQAVCRAVPVVGTLLGALNPGA